MDSSIIVPVTLWSSSHPTFRISSITITPNFETLVTGSHDGQLCLWRLKIDQKELTPTAILLGHDYAVTTLVSTNEFVISTCEGGEICRWNLEDGYCEKKKSTKKSFPVHRNVQLFKRTQSENYLIFTSGDYPGIIVYHSVTLQIICNLYSKTDYNWITNFHCVFKTEDKDCILVSGVTVNGCVKTWLYENSFNQSHRPEISAKDLQIKTIVGLKLNEGQSLGLIVSKHAWFLFSIDFNNLIKEVQCQDGETLSGGDFTDSCIIIWTDTGMFHVYSIKNNDYMLSVALKDDSFDRSLFKAAMTLARNSQDGCYYFCRGHYNGEINTWVLADLTKESLTNVKHPLLTATLKDKWGKTEKGFFHDIVNFSCVTCCAYVSTLDKFFLGCLNGDIVIVPAMQTLMSVYFSSSNEVPSSDTLSGHRGSINCLLYPHEKYSHHDKSYLVSGGNDFSVCLWDIDRLELLYKFCVQGGEIQKLIVPPENFHPHVRYSVCSVSSDHSVAILNLVDRRCVLLTSRHAYPVVSVNWKPLDGFLLVECYDGSVFVWETETGFLDRVLDGVHAQEILFACQENPLLVSSAQLLYNFYIYERTMKNSMKSDLFQIEGVEEDFPESPVVVNNFRTSNTSQSQILLCNLEKIIKAIITESESRQDGVSGEKLYYLTQVSGPEISKKSFALIDKIKRERTENCAVEKKGERAPVKQAKTQNGLGGMRIILRFLLSSMHIWGLNPTIDDLVRNKLGFIKPEVAPPFGIVSSSGVYTLFLSSRESLHRTSTSLTATTCVVMLTLSRVLKSISMHSLDTCRDNENDYDVPTNAWDDLFKFYEELCSNGHTYIPRPKMEILAKAWQSKCLPVRTMIQKLLPSHLEALVHQDYLDLLEFWYDYLPHFKACGKTMETTDLDNADLKTIALVLFGIVGSDLKFKANILTCQKNYIYQTCSSLVYLLLMPNVEDRVLRDLQTMAIDFIGRGYIVWEQYLGVEKIYPILFQLCRNMLKKRFGGIAQAFDKSLAAHDALKAIALSRTSGFIDCLMMEINQPNGCAQPRLDGFSLEHSKPEMLSIIVSLLEKTPYIMLLHLNEVISIFVYCIDSSHLKQENLNNLIPVMRKFRQVDHSVGGQRIAVGLGTGSIVLHDLSRPGRTITVSGHNDSIAALRFSEDGRYLASYSCYENVLIFWQVLTGLFGFGQLQLKHYKSFQTKPVHEEDIRNHMEVAEISWSGSKSVTLKLCGGTQTVYQT